jgi:Zn ribbon nucleic-acid-binding protein
MVASPLLTRPPEFITCEACGGTALLKRRTIDAFRRNGSEIWTFECVDCMYHMQRAKNSDGLELIPLRPS